MDLGLTGKVAMVAGGSQGLGYATAKALATEGAKVSIFARVEDGVHEAAEKLEQETGAPVLGVGGNLLSADDIASWARQTVEKFGPVQVLFANTGGPPPGHFESVTDEGWQKGIDLLLFPVIRMAREVIPMMREAGGGSIVFSTSSGVKIPILNLCVSTVVRASISALSKTLAEDYAPAGIRVNQLVPGRIDTERVRSLDKVNADRSGISVEDQQTRSVGTIPLGRYGKPVEYGDAAAFLLSDRASFITGATLQVDGGMIRSIM